MLLFIGAVLVGGYALFVFDPSVATGYGSRVNNIGLMQDRQNLLLAACAAAVTGAIFMVFGGRGGTKDIPPVSYGDGTALSTEKLSAIEDFRDALKHDVPSVIRTALQAGRVHPYDELPTGRGFLQYAVSEQALSCIPLLLEAGAKPDHPDSTGRTAFDFITASSSPELQSLMRPKPESIANAVASDATAKMMLRLEQLANLHADGILTAEEFDLAKARVLASAQEGRLG
ncbi:SHOCT domain-containing protein [Variovorax sp. WDL1]|uniref:SHOCT domain-containing protein n=1 Tax=Variovorax sp. WDL1 TaxID=207745 RepID=UPI00076D61F9|nr:SHOCT domain-containing protein [Variovorax sp. WDL1]KWT98211.1 hypothetical protein APY03_0882 [Variovorax sp. WDL1]